MIKICKWVMNDTFHKYEQSLEHFKGFSNVNHNVQGKNKNHKHKKLMNNLFPLT